MAMLKLDFFQAANHILDTLQAAKLLPLWRLDLEEASALATIIIRLEAIA
jgi:hypothetical protein